MKTTSLTSIFFLIAISVFAQAPEEEPTITAVDDELLSSIHVFPNPCKDSFNIDNPKNLSYKIVDSLGRPSTAESPGVYFIVFYENKVKHVLRLVKL